MCITFILICLSRILVLAQGKSISGSVPPELCFEPFNGLDCGGSPLHVLYYYKPGSRCEVAIWRGCPTRNIFKDEFECINTCIFIERAQPEEHHNFENDDDYQLEYEDANKTNDELTTIAVDSGYEGDDDVGAKNSGEKDTKEADGEETGEQSNVEKTVDDNTAAENADGDNAAEAKNSDEANNEASEGDEETKVETTSEGTMEIGSEDIGAN